MDFEQYIQQQLLQMQNLQDRKDMRQVLEEVLIPMYQYSEEKYNKLESNILSEEDCSRDAYNIITGIVDRKKYDITSTHMKLMNSSDLNENTVNLTEVLESLKQNCKYRLFPVFMKADYHTIRSFEVSERLFEGVIRTNEGEYKALFKLKRNEEYLKQIYKIYQIFLNNSVRWKTVCAPYLYKIFDIYLCKAEQISGKEIEEIIIKFEEYDPYIKYDYVPIWNLEAINEQSSTFPTPCEDQIHYQHEIYKERLDNCSYMVMNSDIPILNQRRSKGDLHITCRESEAVNWTLLKFCHESKLKYTEPFMHNKCAETGGRHIRTKANLEKYVKSLGYSEYVELKGISTYEGKSSDEETYMMDEFIKDEIVLKDNTNTLIFEFKQITQEFYLNKDILSYIVSKLQWDYPEYHCVGRFV